MKKKFITAIDADGVLRNFVGAFNILMSVKYPDVKYNPIGLENEYMLSGLYPELTNEKIEDIYVNKYPIVCFYHAPQYDGATKFTHDLKEMGCYIKIISAQPTKQIKNLTLEWLKKNNIAYDECIFTYDKYKEDFDVILEDSPIQIAKLIKAKRKVIRFERSWNVGLERKVSTVINYEGFIWRILGEMGGE